MEKVTSYEKVQRLREERDQNREQELVKSVMEDSGHSEGKVRQALENCDFNEAAALEELWYEEYPEEEEDPEDTDE